MIPRTNISKRVALTILRQGLLTACAGLIAVLTEAGPTPWRQDDVCPPFLLRTVDGKIINPSAGQNANLPYSPKRTCGECHDYNRITGAYHFQQGRGEKPTADQAARCQWALSPGNYGGTWCSPAPLYNYLSPKKNPSARTMDLTSFDFISKGCGACHPGGGPLEYDRDGKRYDEWMSNPASGFTPAGNNAFDGDYHKAR